MSSPDHSTHSPVRPIPKPDPDRAIAIEIQPASPRYPLTPSSSSPSSGASSALFATAHGGAAATAPHRKIGIPVDLSNESAFAVRWAVQNYLRPGDAVTLIHVRPTSVLYGADWGSTSHTSAAAAGESNPEEEGEEEVKTRNRKKMEDEFDRVTAGKISELAEPLSEAKIPYRVHTVKDHDMKERLCLEIERLGMSVVIMGSRGFGASAAAARRNSGRLGSVSDYCVHHCVCPVVVVRFPEDSESAGAGGGDQGCLDPVPEEETAAVHDAPPRDHLHEE